MHSGQLRRGQMRFGEISDMNDQLEGRQEKHPSCKQLTPDIPKGSLL